VPRSIISLCLDHTIKSDDQGTVSPVTGRRYDQDPRIGEKREALQRLADPSLSRLNPSTWNSASRPDVCRSRWKARPVDPRRAFCCLRPRTHWHENDMPK
jgi:hypothetical protein